MRKTAKRCLKRISAVLLSLAMVAGTMSSDLLVLQAKAEEGVKTLSNDCFEITYTAATEGSIEEFTGGTDWFGNTGNICLFSLPVGAEVKSFKVKNKDVENTVRHKVIMNKNVADNETADKIDSVADVTECLSSQKAAINVSNYMWNEDFVNPFSGLKSADSMYQITFVDDGNKLLKENVKGFFAAGTLNYNAPTSSMQFAVVQITVDPNVPETLVKSENDSYGTVALEKNGINCWKITAIPKTGYAFDKWTNNNDSSEICDAESVVSPLKLTTYTACFKNLINIETNSEEMGTVSSSVSGSNVVITATPNKGYYLKHWLDIDTGDIFNNYSITIEPTNAKNYRAVFEVCPDNLVDWTYTVTDGVATISSYTGDESETATIPGPRNFATNQGITTVKITNAALKKIGQKAKNVSVADGQIVKPATKSLSSAFSGCTNLQSVNFKGFDFSEVTSLQQAFYNCSALTSVSFEGCDLLNIKSLEKAFYKCSKLTELDLSGLNPEADMITKYAFYFCSGLTTIYMPEGVDWSSKEAQSYVFSGCDKLAGGNGTTYLSEKVDNAYAKIDGGTDNPGYFTAKAVPNYTMTTVTESDKAGGVKYEKLDGKNKFHITAEANVGYSFIKWTNNVNYTEIYSADTTVVLSGNTVYTAHFGKETEKGDGTKGDPFKISNFDDLNSIASQVNKGNAFENTYFKFTSDITIPADFVGLGSLKEGATDPELGKNINPFSGNIDGNNHTLTIEEGGKALIRYARGASVSNLNIYGTQIDDSGLLSNYAIDYGPSGQSSGTIYDAGTVKTLDVTNVTIKEGTKILKSGFASGFPSAANSISIDGCTVEDGVIIGYDKTQSSIGSFLGGFCGKISNSKSAATVYGVDKVGGIAGVKAQSMSTCRIENCSFTGKVEATGNYVGGIIGSGYSSSNKSAPNTLSVSVKNCKVSGNVVASDYVGGIFGGEPEQDQCWENGIGYIQNNQFTGSVKATNGNNVGGIIGFMRSLDRYNIIENNVFKQDGSLKGIGNVLIVDTSYYSNASNSPVGMKDGVFYLNSEEDEVSRIQNAFFETGLGEGCSKTYQRFRVPGYNRTDDPLGKDADKLACVYTVNENTEAAEGKIDAAFEKVEAITSTTATAEANKEVVDSVVEATKAYEALTDAEKASLPVEVKEKIEKAQEKAGEINHTAGDVKVDGVDWNIKVEASVAEADSAEVKTIEESAGEKLTDGTALVVYDISLTDVMDGTKVEPGQDGIKITLPVPESAKGFDNIIVAHLRADGVIEYVVPEVSGDVMTFKLASLSPVSIVGYNGEEVKEAFTDDTTAKAETSTNEPDKTTSPNTGDAMGAGIYVYVGLMMLCAAAFVVIKRRREY